MSVSAHRPLIDEEFDLEDGYESKTSYRRSMRVCACSLSDLRFFGVGITQFFTFLIVMGAALSLMFVVSVPAVVTNINSNKGALKIKTWTTLSSLASNAVSVHGGCDMVTVLVFVVAIVLLARWQTKTANSVRAQTWTAGDYTVVAYRLPIDVDRREITEHFSKYGTIQKAIIVDENGAVLSALRERAEVMEKLWEFRLAKTKPPEQRPSLFITLAQLLGYYRDQPWYEQKVAALDSKIEKEGMRTWFANPSVVVTFTTVAAARSCIADHSPISVMDSILSFFCPCSCCDSRPSIRGNVLKVRRAPEPSDILWGNLAYDTYSRGARILITSLLSVLSILGVSAFLTWFQFWEDEDALKRTHIQRVIESLLFSVIIFVVNLALTVILRLASGFEHPHSKTELQAALMVKIFAWQYLNSMQGCFVWAFTQYKGPGDELALARASESWVYSVGQLMYHVMIVDLVLSFGVGFGVPLFMSYQAAQQAKNAATQRDKERILEGEDFLISNIYARTLKVIFLALTFSTALPFILLIAGIETVVIFWSNRYLLLRVFKRPPKFDDSMAASIERLLPFAVVLHSIFALFLFNGSSMYVVALIELIVGLLFLIVFQFSKSLKFCGCGGREEGDFYNAPKYDNNEDVEEYVLPQKNDLPPRGSAAVDSTYMPPTIGAKGDEFKPASTEALVAKMRVDALRKGSTTVRSSTIDYSNPYRETMNNEKHVDLGFLDTVTAKTDTGSTDGSDKRASKRESKRVSKVESSSGGGGGGRFSKRFSKKPPESEVERQKEVNEDVMAFLDDL